MPGVASRLSSINDGGHGVERDKDGRGPVRFRAAVRRREMCGRALVHFHEKRLVKSRLCGT